MSDQELTKTEETTEAEAVATPQSSSSETVSEVGGEVVMPEDLESSTETDKESVDDSLTIHDLRVGQHLVGTVKNITDFGAFVDIGIPQDGLVHISKLARRKVATVTDVVSQGQEVEVWVKKVDTKRGRLSLTMIKPISLRLKDIDDDMELEGVVTRLEPYGAFVDIGSERDGLVHISQITHDYIKHPQEALAVGDLVNVKTLKVNRKKRQIDLSIKALLPPPQKEVEAVEKVKEKPKVVKKAKVAAQTNEAESEPMLTSMAVAYAALQSEEDPTETVSAKEKHQQNSEMDAIITRTLARREK